MGTLQESIAAKRQNIKVDRMDMSFGEIINMYKDHEIIISPEYQRAFRWDQQHQTDFIESILLGIPFPSIFVAANEDGTWELIDGLQRVSTVLSFFGELNHPTRNNLILCQGSLIKDLEGLTINTIPLDLKLSIKRTPCRVEIIQRESQFDMRYELFKRLNTGGEGLEPQEIRNCVFRGLQNHIIINNMISNLSCDENLRSSVLISTSMEEKMYFEELVLRLYSLHYFINEYTEQSVQDFFDKVMRQESEKPHNEYIEEYSEKFPIVFEFINNLPMDDSPFKLSRRNFSTSMFDAIGLSLMSLSNDVISSMDKTDFVRKLALLKEDTDFKAYSGSASSSVTNIRGKVSIAKKRLLNG